ncbi:glycosyl transferase family 1 [Candidatus Heimdallarchaeota archaeon B3_Heim]|nr:MAG: glycosyl transferase family 1 [Candidatus Heimdallarchaeota archaeon B3_Heim]
MNIAMVHFRVGELDGVSLEMDKWKKVLEEKFKHEVIYLAGSLGRSDGISISEFSLDFVPGQEIRKAAFSSPLNKSQEKALEVEIRTLIYEIKPKILKFIEEYNIQCFIPNNMFSLPLNIPASLALFEILQETGIPTISHNHDFTWERTSYNPSCSLIKDYLDKYFPPKLPNIRHAVINSIAKDVLSDKKSIESVVVPNVFYFEEPDWVKDSFNSDVRATLNISNSDIIILQATRLVDRKGIELIIDVIARLNTKEYRKQLSSKPLYDGRRFTNNDKILIVMPNLVEDITYKNKLEKKCNELSVEYRFCNPFFAHQRSEVDNEKKIYNLWDIYSHSDFVSYPSLVEGWGNQFLEAVKAKLPIILYEYDVYIRDIGPLGFSTISLGSDLQKSAEHGLVTVSDERIKQAADETVLILQDNTLREKMVNKNFEIGLKELSITALGKYLNLLLSSL